VEDLQRRKPAPGDVGATIKDAFTVSPEFKLNMDKFTSKLADRFKDTFDIKVGSAASPGGCRMPWSPVAARMGVAIAGGGGGADGR
jgi:hypothetical protein